jgi:hypothetical protein
LAGLLLRSKCRKVGEKTAEKIKLAWERAHGGARLFKSGGKGGKGGAAQADATGLTMQELQARPPTLGFGWTAGTRCYTPQLHAAELAVAERSLQKAALHRQPSAGQASKVRKWVAANQSTTGGLGFGGWGGGHVMLAALCSMRAGVAACRAFTVTGPILAPDAALCSHKHRPVLLNSVLSSDC